MRTAHHGISVVPGARSPILAGQGRTRRDADAVHTEPRRRRTAGNPARRPGTRTTRGLGPGHGVVRARRVLLPRRGDRRRDGVRRVHALPARHRHRRCRPHRRPGRVLAAAARTAGRARATGPAGPAVRVPARRGLAPRAASRAAGALVLPVGGGRFADARRVGQLHAPGPVGDERAAGARRAARLRPAPVLVPPVRHVGGGGLRPAVVRGDGPAADARPAGARRGAGAGPGRGAGRARAGGGVRRGRDRLAGAALLHLLRPDREPARHHPDRVLRRGRRPHRGPPPVRDPDPAAPPRTRDRSDSDDETRTPVPAA